MLLYSLAFRLADDTEKTNLSFESLYCLCIILGQFSSAYSSHLYLTLQKVPLKIDNRTIFSLCQLTLPRTTRFIPLRSERGTDTYRFSAYFVTTVIMDSLEANFIPPPAYCEEEFDQKTSRAAELSLELAKWQTPEVEIDEEGFPRYDPAMFEETKRAQKGKDQPATTTFRSSSISKRPLPNPKSSTSSNNAGPSTLRQTQPLHISKKSISKAEEAAQDIARPHSTKRTQEEIPPYAAPPSPQSIPAQSIDATPEDNPPYTVMDPCVSNSSVPNQSIDDTPEDNPPYEPNYHPTELPYAEQPQRGNWEEDTTPGQDVISEPVPDEPLDRPQSSELELPEHLGQGHEILNSNIVMANQMLDRSVASNPPLHRGPQTATVSNQMRDSQSQYSISPNPQFHRGLNPNTATTSDQMLDSQSQYSRPPNPSFHRGLNPNTATMSNQMLDSQPQYSMPPNPSFHRGLNPNTMNQMLDSQPQYSMAPNTASTMSNHMRDSQSQYSVALNPPVFRGPPQQHFSLPPAPRIAPRNHPSDRPRSHSTSPPFTPTQPAITPRVLFNHNVAYGTNVIGGQVAHFRPKVHTSQPPLQAPYDPTTFYK